MKRNFSIYPIVILCTSILFGGGCIVSVGTDHPRRIRGSGNLESRSIEVSDFSRVSMGIAGELYIRQGNREELTISAQPNLFPYIDIFVDGNRLRIETDNDISLDPTRPITIQLTVVSLNDLVFAGDGLVSAETLESSALSVTLAGSGDIEIDELTTGSLETVLAGSGDIFYRAGEATEHDIVLAGSGDIEARALVSREAEVEIAGSGDVFVDVSDRLQVSIIGSGSVKYRGNPQIQTNIVGSGSVGPLIE